MNDDAVCRTTPATPGLLVRKFILGCLLFFLLTKIYVCRQFDLKDHYRRMADKGKTENRK